MISNSIVLGNRTGPFYRYAWERYGSIAIYASTS